MSLNIPVLLPDTLERLDLSYSSGVWKNALPSYVFIIPFIGKHEGFALLLEVTKDARRDIKHVVNHTSVLAENLLTVTARAGAIPAQLFDRVGRSLTIIHANASDTNLQEAREELQRNTTRLINANRYLTRLKTRQKIAIDYHNRAVDLWDHLDVLRKITSTLHTIHREFGANFVASPLAIRKLTVCMKCLDSAWANMRYAYKAMKVAEGAMARETYMFPFEEFSDLFEIEN